MTLKIKKIEFSEFLVILALIFYLFSSVIDGTIFITLHYKIAVMSKLISYVSFLLLVSSFYFNRFYKLKKKTIIYLLIMISLIFILPLFTGMLFQILFLIMFILSGMNIKTDYILRVFVIEMVILLGCIFIFAKLGLIRNFISHNDGRVAEYLGFTYYSILPNYFFQTVLVFYSLKDKKLNFINISIIVIINLLLYELTTTRAVMYEIFLLLILLFIERHLKKIVKTKFCEFIFLVSMPFLSILMFVLSFFYSENNKFLSAINGLLSGRLSLGKKAIELFGIHPFGSKIEWSVGTVGLNMKQSTEYMYVDSSYLNGLLNYGYVFMVLITIGFLMLIYKNFQDKNYKCCICLFLLSIHCFTDPQLLSVKYDPFLVCIGTVLVNRKVHVEKSIVTDFFKGIIEKSKFKKSNCPKNESERQT